MGRTKEIHNAVTMNIYLTKEKKNAIVEYAWKERMSVSAYLRKIVLKHLDEKARQEATIS